MKQKRKAGIKKRIAAALSVCLLVSGLFAGAGDGVYADDLAENDSMALASLEDDSAVQIQPTEKSYAASAEGDRRIRVDINANDGRQNAYSPTFYNWKVPNGTSASEKIDGVTFVLSNGGSSGSGIKAANYKKLIESDDSTPYLTLDGVYVDGAESSGTIKLEIKGLPAGTHTLTTWHSFFDNVEGSSMSVTINGEVTAAGVPGPTRVRNDADAGISYSTFEASEGKTVTVLITSENNNTYKNAVLNAFEIDGANPLRGIQNAVPADGETHHEEQAGLVWDAADGATAHDVYLGTSYTAVDNATKASNEYMGTQSHTGYALSELSPFETYYWRVDEQFSDGTVKGEVRMFQITRLAFPTAEGYGRYAKAGRGGRIIEVTNLNDSGPGSLRQAVEVEKGARIVVFKVGGIIELKSKLVVPSDGGDLYVAGQTAPGDGITLTHYGFGIYYAKDVVIRHIRTRVGDESGVTQDGMGMAGADYSIIDHCSISWTTDEGTSSRGAKRITFQHNIIAEALNNSIHYDASDRTKTERHSFAGSISGNVGSYHHNLLVNCTGRNWSLAGGMEQDGVRYAGKLDIRNNVVYNWRDRTTDGGVGEINFVNNYYKQGAVSRNMNIFSIDGDELNTGDMQQAYLSGNKMVKIDGSVILDSSEDTWKKATSKFNSVSEVKSAVPFFESYVKTETADEAYESVLRDVGATRPRQDDLDTRYIRETKNGTYTYKGSKDGWAGIIDSQEDVGGYPNASNFSGGEAPADSDHDGMPDEWETQHGLDPNDDSDASGFDLSEEYYTNVEMYLNELAGDPVVYRESGAEGTPQPSAGESEKPMSSDNPDESMEPSGSEHPTESESPAESEGPAESSSPKESERPAESNSPAESEGPTESGSPKESEGPAESGSPKESEGPAESGSPAESEGPVESASPKESEGPAESGSPAESEEPGGTIGPLSFYYGDVDMDGTVTAADALMILQHVVKLRPLKDPNALVLADPIEDGLISASDALWTLQCVVRLRELRVCENLKSSSLSI